MFTISAVVATRNRPELLKSRALKSIAAQTRRPDRVVVVDDSDAGARRANREILDGFGSVEDRTYLENRRTRGASGAWNTALAHLQGADPGTFVAILDDDDSWEPTYLESCARHAARHNLDMVAAGINYIKDNPAVRRRLPPPERLDVDDLLVRNTHIQGSNLFVRLRSVLEAGGFDESLASTTDRDMCIRLADTGTVGYGPLDEYLVCHHADDDRPRLSTPGGGAKAEGLRAFHRKYNGRMSERQRFEFAERCRRLFGCDPASGGAPAPPGGASGRNGVAHGAARAPGPPHDGTATDALDLVVGAITSPDAARPRRLLDSLLKNFGGRDDARLEVVLLENGGRDDASRTELRRIAGSASERGMAIDLVSLERQASDMDAGMFSVGADPMSERMSIAAARTMLQHYLYRKARTRRDPVVWILDDDVVLESLEQIPDGSVRARRVDYVPAIRELKRTGNGIVLCRVTGDPPVPFQSCIRTQLVDLVCNLHRLAGARPGDALPGRHGENALARLSWHDYYYDLSRSHTAHLECPFWYETTAGSTRAGDVFEEMVSRLPSMLNGVQVFRPLLGAEAGRHESGLRPSVNRGPATLVFDVDAMRDFPNAAAEVDGADSRRSDMVWCLLNRFVGGRRTVQSSLPVRQVRNDLAYTGMDPAVLEQDIGGHALYSALGDFWTLKAGNCPHGRGFLDLGDDEIRTVEGMYLERVRERFASFEMNRMRIAGLLSTLRRMCTKGGDDTSAPWWLEAPRYAESAGLLRRFVADLEAVHAADPLEGLRRRVAGNDTSHVKRFLRGLPAVVARHRAGADLPPGLLAAAESRVRSEFKTGPLRFVGAGREGAVFTDGCTTYKCFHDFRAPDRGGQVEFLMSLEGRLEGYATLRPVTEVRDDGARVVVTHPYERGHAYAGGHLRDLFALLRECRLAGMACRNIHPDNLLVTEGGLRFVDYGSDTVPYTDEDGEQMCRRALLTYRFHFRRDLKRLMNAALADAGLPELAELERFRNGAFPRDLDALFYRPQADIVAGLRPKTVMDYGCGGGSLAEMIAEKGASVTGYDIDDDAVRRCGERRGLAACGGRDLRARLLDRGARFDVVLCSRVLCTIQNTSELESVLDDMRTLVSDSGRAVVSVCSPFGLSAASTELEERHAPPNARYDDTFVYSKTLKDNGNCRDDVHRSHSAYMRAFAKAGFRIDGATELTGTDTDSLLPSSDAMVFRLAPAPLGPRVSLLIKTNAMEWGTIERQARHLVDRLGTPVGFAERVVVVDPHKGSFPRQYCAPDPAKHGAAMERLLRDGVVDRVVRPQLERDAVRAVYARWFGEECDDARASNGQQLFATLFGFESCTGDYVLQVDSDVLVAKADATHDYLSEMAGVLRGDPSALFVAMNTCGSGRVPYTPRGHVGDWRVKVRGCLFDRRRLLSVLPIPNKLEGGRLLPWHRAFDGFVSSSKYGSYRGGDRRTGVIHVPNDRKRDEDGWMCTMDAVERGHIPEAQYGKPELTGTGADWAGPRRNESFVFVVCGRNVHLGRFRLCFESMSMQRRDDWGAVIVDDASDNGFWEYARMLSAGHADRITAVRNRTRRGTLYNTWRAVTEFCGNPDTVIITLDADDSLATEHALDRVGAEYDDGADMTVGTMLRRDKESSYPVDFADPRRPDSNVWQHLRSFRKYLFDAIDADDLMMDGKWMDEAADWAYMVPIAEMASSPRHIPDILYHYEPSAPKTAEGRRERDRVISRILEKPKYGRLRRGQR